MALSEIEIFNLVRSLLAEADIEVVQLVPPGGQAPFSLTFFDEKLDRDRTIFPDLVAYAGDRIFLGEMKPQYSEADCRKLLSVSGSKNGIERLKELVVSRSGNSSFLASKVTLLLLHSQIAPPLTNEIIQVVFQDGDIVVYKQNEKINTANPFKINCY